MKFDLIASNLNKPGLSSRRIYRRGLLNDDAENKLITDRSEETMSNKIFPYKFFQIIFFQIYAMMNCSMNSSQTVRSRLLLLFKISRNQFFTGTSQTSLEKIHSIPSTSPPRLELARCCKTCFLNLFLRLISFLF